jgi:hypothetical protein
VSIVWRRGRREKIVNNTGTRSRGDGPEQEWISANKSEAQRDGILQVFLSETVLAEYEQLEGAEEDRGETQQREHGVVEAGDVAALQSLSSLSVRLVTELIQHVDDEHRGYRLSRLGEKRVQAVHQRRGGASERKKNNNISLASRP